METNVTSSSRDAKRGGKRGRDSIRREGLFDGHVHDGVLKKIKRGAPSKRPSEAGWQIFLQSSYPLPSSGPPGQKQTCTFVRETATKE